MSPYGDKTAAVKVNGANTNQLLRGNGLNFGASVVGKFQLLAGQNTVTITKNWGYYGIDYILLTPVATEPPKIVPLVNGRAEAEAGNLTGVTVATANAGYSGMGYVTGFNGTNQVSITVNATGGLYDLSVGYTSPFGDKGVDFQAGRGRFVHLWRVSLATKGLTFRSTMRKAVVCSKERRAATVP